MKKLLINFSTVSFGLASLFFAIGTIWIAIQKNGYGSVKYMGIATAIMLFFGLTSGLTSVFMKTKTN